MIFGSAMTVLVVERRREAGPGALKISKPGLYYLLLRRWGDSKADENTVTGDRTPLA
jgi:hypothetical protein